jgi:hypothetical protein
MFDAYVLYFEPIEYRISNFHLRISHLENEIDISKQNVIQKKAERWRI